MSVVSLNAQCTYDKRPGAFDVISKGLCEMDTLIKHGKLVEAFCSVSDVFFSAKMPFEDNFKGALKTLKGWNALGGLPKQIMATTTKIYQLVAEKSFNAFMACTAAVAGSINKTYDAASFLEKQIGIPFFAGISDSYKTTHFQAVGVGAAVRFTNAAPSVVHNPAARFQAVESLAGMVFAGSILAGGGAQLTTAASAVGAVTKGIEYIWKNIL